MATLNQIKVNTGTEENPSYVLHDVHDKRLDDGASSLVTTCTHLLATNAALSSFNPITSANLASVLGGVMVIGTDEKIDANDARLRQVGFHIFGVNTQTGGTEYNYPPSSADSTRSVAQCTLVSIFTSNSYGHQIFHRRASINYFIRSYENSVWQPWTKIPGVSI